MERKRRTASISAVKRKGRTTNLMLLATLPPKPGSSKTADHQQRIGIKCQDTPAGWKTAKRKLKELQRQLDHDTFQWSDWDEKVTGNTLTWKAAIEKLRVKRCELGRTGESTWEKSYMGRLKQIPQNEPVTTKGIAEAITKYRRDQCSYKELYYLLVDLAQLCSIEFPELPVPTYNSANGKTKEVPTDEEIIAWVQASSTPEAEWAFGMMAAYGLRDHELMHVTFIDDDNAIRTIDTKLTPPLEREVIPVKPEWVELFKLRKIRMKDFSNLRTTIPQWLSHERKAKIEEKGIPTWNPYALRHAYAGRLWKYGVAELDVFTAARLMGHTPEQHQKTYRAHIASHRITDRARRAIASGLKEESE